MAPFSIYFAVSLKLVLNIFYLKSKELFASHVFLFGLWVILKPNIFTSFRPSVPLHHFTTLMLAKCCLSPSDYAINIIITTVNVVYNEVNFPCWEWGMCRSCAGISGEIFVLNCVKIEFLFCSQQCKL